MATGTFDLLHPGHGIYLNEAKKLGGEDAKLYVVIALDSTVEKRKRYPIVGEQQRLELIKMIKGVDEAYLGNENGDFLKIDHLGGVLGRVFVGELFCVNSIGVHGLLPPS